MLDKIKSGLSWLWTAVILGGLTFLFYVLFKSEKDEAKVSIKKIKKQRWQKAKDDSKKPEPISDEVRNNEIRKLNS